MTDEGTRLPVVDITNPAFDIEVDQAELPTFTSESLGSLERWSRVPGPARRLLARRSLLLDDGWGAADAFVSGMTTYLLKLGNCRVWPNAAASCRQHVGSPAESEGNGRVANVRKRPYAGGMLEAATGVEPVMEVLQTSALPLGYAASA
jgi:hypothetical protein